MGVREERGERTQAAQISLSTSRNPRSLFLNCGIAVSLPLPARASEKAAVLNRFRSDRRNGWGVLEYRSEKGSRNVENRFQSSLGIFEFGDGRVFFLCQRNGAGDD